MRGCDHISPIWSVGGDHPLLPHPGWVIPDGARPLITAFRPLGDMRRCEAPRDRFDGSANDSPDRG